MRVKLIISGLAAASLLGAQSSLSHKLNMRPSRR
jgi:hypothetical protein